MARKKKKSRLKKILKAVGKAALLGGAAYGASKLFGGRKGNVSKTAASEDANVGINTRPGLIDAQDAGTNFVRPPKVYPDPIMHGGVGVKHSKRPVWTGDQTMAANRGIFMKKGGRVTGIAKRGFGRALMKGKK